MILGGENDQLWSKFWTESASIPGIPLDGIDCVFVLQGKNGKGRTRTDLGGRYNQFGK